MSYLDLEVPFLLAGGRSDWVPRDPEPMARIVERRRVTRRDLRECALDGCSIMFDPAKRPQRACCRAHGYELRKLTLATLRAVPA